jgi:hypothetical protein
VLHLVLVELVELVEMVEMVEKRLRRLRRLRRLSRIALLVSWSLGLLVLPSYSLSVETHNDASLQVPGFLAETHNDASLRATGYGPEDLVMDSLNNPPRVLISCAGRRAEYPDYGEIQAYYPESGKLETLKRVHEPAGLVFRPHGISLLTLGPNRYLFVISHDEEARYHPVLRYRVSNDTLFFEKVFHSSLLVSPNALQAYPDGSILVCNDAAKRGSMAEKIFRLKRGNIVRFDGFGNWSVVAAKLGMPAGLAGSGEDLYVCGSLENRLYRFTYKNGELTGKRTLNKIKGGDNIRIYEGFLLTTSHAKPLKFISHVGNREKPSPSLVLKIDTTTGSSTVLYSDNGRIISAASAALIWNRQLIVGQIFEPAILINQLE